MPDNEFEHLAGEPANANVPSPTKPPLTMAHRVFAVIPLTAGLALIGLLIH